MKLKSISKMNIVVSTFITLLMILDVYKLYDIGQQKMHLEESRLSLLLKANTLKESSESLTKFARMYAITKDISYMNSYYNIIEDREGKKSHPSLYNQIYFSGKSKAITGSSLLSKIKSLPITKSELNHLLLAEERSSVLTFIEKKSFDLIEQNRPEEALSLLTNQEYSKCKNLIMLPLNTFFMELNDRISNEISELNKEERIVFIILFLLVLTIALHMFILLIVFRLRVLIPITQMNHCIEKYKQNSILSSKMVGNNDEVGEMINSFVEMQTILTEKREKLEVMAVFDDLTKIYNRRAFYELSEQEILLAQKKNADVSLLMIDIDFFKKINDEFGHPVGDKALLFLSSAISGMIRKGDIFGRLGGEEFAILFPHTSIKEAYVISEKIRLYFQNNSLPNSDPIVKFTLSLGLCSCSPEYDLNSSITIADNLLYKSKHNGRNKTTINSDVLSCF